jgi:FKBP-type peptidyl-prolyl cis-trans isomerase 2
VGDDFDFKLSAAQGYGEVDPNAVVELSKVFLKLTAR